MEKLVNIDETLVSDALDLSGLSNQDDVINLSLRMFLKIRLKKQEIIKRYKGTLKWQAVVSSKDSSIARREEIRAVT